MATPRLDFRLDQFGWADLVISDGGGEHQIDSISYCTDALADLLLLGVSAACRGYFDFTFFDHEPGMTYLVVNQQERAIPTIGGDAEQRPSFALHVVDAKAPAAGEPAWQPS